MRYSDDDDDDDDGPAGGLARDWDDDDSDDGGAAGIAAKLGKVNMKWRGRLIHTTTITRLNSSVLSLTTNKKHVFLSVMP